MEKLKKAAFEMTQQIYDPCKQCTKRTVDCALNDDGNLCEQKKVWDRLRAIVR